MNIPRSVKQLILRLLKWSCVLIPLTLWIIFKYPGILYSPGSVGIPPSPNPDHTPEDLPFTYSEALRLRASPSGNILLALADMGAFEMAVNFFETSLKKLNITSYLFLSPHAKTCDLLRIEGIACFVYGSDPASDKRSDFMSKDFVRKMNIRTRMILEALKLGYNVLHTDVDVFFYRDPFGDLPCQDGSCDAAILLDGILHNAGFLYIHATPGSIALYEDMQKTAETTRRDDQTALNDALLRLRNIVNFISLPIKKYACGKNFYELRRNSGDGLPADFTKDVIVAHNNWIVGIDAKVYRFKETQQWYYDGNAYYSSKTRKYLIYENTSPKAVTIQKAEVGWEEEKTALQNALMIGFLLNRTVILPQFHWGVRLCSFLCWIKFKDFEEVFADRYREHLFLSHPKVPDSTSNSLSTEYSILLRNEGRNSTKNPGTVVYRPANLRKGPTAREIKGWFGSVTKKVLRFSDLYGNYESLRRLAFEKNLTFKTTFDKTFIRGSYRQY